MYVKVKLSHLVICKLFRRAKDSDLKKVYFLGQKCWATYSNIFSKGPNLHFFLNSKIMQNQLSLFCFF